jgi:hypothetical protein
MIDSLALVQPEPECDLCGDTGEMTWQQPIPGPDGAWTLTQMSHPCVNGCSGWWKAAAAEQDIVVEPDGTPMAAGNVAQANQQQRTDWLLPTFPARDTGAMPNRCADTHVAAQTGEPP